MLSQPEYSNWVQAFAGYLNIFSETVSLIPAYLQLVLAYQLWWSFLLINDLITLQSIAQIASLKFCQTLMLS